MMHGEDGYVSNTKAIVNITRELADGIKAIPGLRLERSNVGRGFDEGRPAIADAVGRMIAAHPDWIESVVTDPVTRHFWGERGASRIRDRWSAPRTSGAAA